jgi:hypothetical protein
MGQKNDLDPLQEWGAEAAVIALIGGVLGAVAILIYAVMQGGSLGSAALPAIAVAAVGGGLAWLIMRARKQRERASRPAWMGHTQQWRDELHAKLESKDKPS